MELEELKAAWQELNTRVTANENATDALWQELKRDQMRRPLERVTWGLAFEVVTNVVLVVMTGSLLVSLPRTPAFLLPGIALHLVAMLIVAVSIRHLVFLKTLDYAAPVVELQQRLATLRAARLRFHSRVLLLSPLLWTPLSLVLARACLGLDLYRAFGPLWVISNVLFGIAFIPMMLFVAHRYRDAFSRSRVLQHLMDDLAGRNLGKAQEIVEEIAAFARS